MSPSLSYVASGAVRLALNISKKEQRDGNLHESETNCPRLREQRRVRGRKIVCAPLLFPGYAFVLVAASWWTARWSPGVIRIIMNGLQPAHVSDAVINEIKSRERGGLVELPKLRLEPGARVRVLQGPLQDQIGLLAALRPHERGTGVRPVARLVARSGGPSG